MAKNHTAVFLYKGKKITAISTIAVITALSGFLELTVVKFRIESVFCKKLFVITDLDNPALIHYQNGIGIFIVDNL